MRTKAFSPKPPGRGTVGFLAVASIVVLGLAVLFGRSVVDERSHTAGLVVSVSGGDCTIRFADSAGVTRTFHDTGGRGGCAKQVGQSVGVWYDQKDASQSDDDNPSTRWFGAAIFGTMGVALLACVLRLLKKGAWTRGG